MAEDVKTWTHLLSSPEDMDTAVAFRGWGSGGRESINHLRTLGAVTAALCARLSSKPPVFKDGKMLVPDIGATQDPVILGLANTFVVLNKRIGSQGTSPPSSFTTSNADGQTSAIPPVPIPVVIGVALVITGAIGLCAYFSRDVVDRELSRTEETKRMVIRHQQSLDMLKNKKPGEALTPEEKQLFSSLLDDQKAAAAKTEAPPGGGDGVTMWVIAGAALAAVVLLKS